VHWVYERGVRSAISILLFLMAAVPARAQQTSIHLGGQIGVPINRNIPPPPTPGLGSSTVSPQGPRIIMAPAFTFFVDNRLAVDVEPLFRPIRYETDEFGPRVSTFDTTRATSLEIPVIVSYHFTPRQLRPWAGAGLIAYEKSWGRVDGRGVIHDQGDRQTHVVFTFSGVKPTTPPLIVNAGLDYFRNGWSLRPEIRYTHSTGSSGRRPDQWDALIGVTFRVFEHRAAKAGS
jgi:hypothetical protein